MKFCTKIFNFFNSNLQHNWCLQDIYVTYKACFQKSTTCAEWITLNCNCNRNADVTSWCCDVTWRQVFADTNNLWLTVYSINSSSDIYNCSKSTQYNHVSMTLIISVSEKNSRDGTDLLNCKAFAQLRLLWWVSYCVCPLIHLYTTLVYPISQMYQFWKQTCLNYIDLLKFYSIIEVEWTG